MKNITVYLDLDGVLVNWLQATLTLLDLDYSDTDLQQKIKNDYNYLDELVGIPNLKKTLNLAGSEFWKNLDFLPWGRNLVKAISAKYPTCFLTSPGLFAEAAKGKMQWQQKHFPDIPIIICRHKNWVAGPNKYLIDDDEGQTTRFALEGGRSWLWPQQFNLLTDEQKVVTEINSVLADLDSFQRNWLVDYTKLVG